jgi:hypothetical protein
MYSLYILRGKNNSEGDNLQVASAADPRRLVNVCVDGSTEREICGRNSAYDPSLGPFNVKLHSGLQSPEKCGDKANALGVYDHVTTTSNVLPTRQTQFRK